MLLIDSDIASQLLIVPRFIIADDLRTTLYSPAEFGSISKDGIECKQLIFHLLMELKCRSKPVNTE